VCCPPAWPATPRCSPGRAVNLRNACFERDRRRSKPLFVLHLPHLFAAYLRHLFKAGELLAYRLATIHNVHFLLQLMRDLRAAIAAGSFAAFRDPVPGPLPDHP